MKVFFFNSIVEKIFSIFTNKFSENTRKNSEIIFFEIQYLVNNFKLIQQKKQKHIVLLKKSFSN